MFVVREAVEQSIGPADYSRLAAAWAGTFGGVVSGQEIVLGLTALYTVLQIFVLLRDKVFRRSKQRPKE